ncbi:GSCFA domain-containing protein [Reichenbachiella ulvae]|uniref:GSCFA domain-containing protein n=1 Tax=Reichenbachiella ulvae TaxID=2980104 RepID=A0ABT3CRU9_9BACT|nr:GSCFA domain-containing protein [Reichenbachiella ulvae]MCV9386214.1 GSCFA domain-containing protein [Reichenbachiella ulvae]
MDLQTKIKRKPFLHQMALGHKVLSIGSCFADRMGGYLQDYKFDALVNPFGVIFNPVSLIKLIDQKSDPEPDKFIERDGMVCHYDYHFDLRADSVSSLETLLRAKHQEVNAFIQKADWLIVTLGTAHVYELVVGAGVVANCHKVPQGEFNKRLLSLEEMKTAFVSFQEGVKQLNPSLKIILTVSPVRHVKDGMEENQLSKSLLRVLCSELEGDDVYYFPSYEIMMDELRDYRFYKEDMIHPSAQAEQYIWEYFQEVAFEEPARVFMKEWKQVLSALNHKAFNPNSAAHKRFVQSILSRIESLPECIDYSKEKQVLESQLG